MKIRRRTKPHRTRPRRGRRGPGFWSGFAHATHTNQLRHRLGGATGRAVIRGVNRHRARRGLPPIPLRGSWLTGAGRPTGRPSTGRRPGTARPAGREPAFSGPHVKATNHRRRPPLFGTSVTSSGLAGPGNRGAGAGMGIPAPGTGGEHGGGTPPRPTGWQPARTPGHRRIFPSLTDADLDFFWHRGNGHRGPLDRDGKPPVTPAATPAASTSNGRTPMGNIDALSEPPVTDADHLEKINEVADEIQQWSDRLAEYIGGCQTLGMDDEALDSAKKVVELLGEAASEAGNMGSDFENHYSGVREDAAAGKTIVGKDGPNEWWTGEA